jgi:hypothetical protein
LICIKFEATRLPLWGQKPKWPHVNGTSALTPTADIDAASDVSAAIETKIVADCTAAARRAHRHARRRVSRAARPRDAICRRFWPGGAASRHRGVEGCHLDCYAFIAKENAQRGLDRDCG